MKSCLAAGKYLLNIVGVLTRDIPESIKLLRQVCVCGGGGFLYMCVYVCVSVHFCICACVCTCVHVYA